jgi:hypothetical protein
MGKETRGLKHFARYRPYLPAITTFTGAVIVASGLLFDQGSEFFRFMGASIASIGAFWSAHRQITGAAQQREKDQKIIDLSEQLYGYATGGDSFCYAYPAFDNNQQTFHWMFIHQGRFPLIDLSVRIYNMANPGGDFGSDKTYNLGTTFPGRAHTFANTAVEPRLRSHGYNLFFFSQGTEAGRRKFAGLTYRRG